MPSPVNLSLDVDIEALVRETVEGALASALAAKGNTVVQEIVRRALNSKTDNYSKETVLQESLRKAIVCLAQVRVTEWAAGHQAEIQTAVDGEVRKLLSPQFVAQNVAKAIGQLKFQVTPFAPATEEED